MKHLVLCLTAFLSIAAGLQAQSKKELSTSLSKDLEAYRKYTLALDFNQSLQFMPPKLFDIVPKDTMKVSMIRALDNEYMTIQMTGFEYDPKSKPKIKKADTYYWALVPYNGTMRMNLKGEATFKELLIPIFKQQYGDKNVTEVGESGLDIQMKNKKLIAFKEPGSEVWYMIEDKRFEKGEESESQKMLLKSVLPEPVSKALKIQ